MQHLLTNCLVKENFNEFGEYIDTEYLQFPPETTPLVTQEIYDFCDATGKSDYTLDMKPMQVLKLLDEVYISKIFKDAEAIIIYFDNPADAISYYFAKQAQYIEI